MGRQHHPSKADRAPVTRRYVARTVQRARDEILAAIVVSDRLRGYDEPNVDPLHRCVYPWDQIVASKKGGPSPRCRLCGVDADTSVMRVLTGVHDFDGSWRSQNTATKES
jgi:hypothetical protein